MTELICSSTRTPPSAPDLSPQHLDKPYRSTTLFYCSYSTLSLFFRLTAATRNATIHAHAPPSGSLARTVCMRRRRIVEIYGAECRLGPLTFSSIITTLLLLCRQFGIWMTIQLVAISPIRCPLTVAMTVNCASILAVF
ncbi:hypothetical protein BDN70DRAFT_97614 [Pholiota conissans]|uniref:Uncharacterized protein n=1 Tax=Pholiota conissans TaxID=109636 RepID=A0A9P5Z0T8_9AGAR|nr:hypothetical protein BDN70DRAFT_97614 [Pholiota conissans]